MIVISRENHMRKCQRCSGHKYVNGMGNMREKCKSCDGKGFLSEAEPLKMRSEIKKSKVSKNDKIIR
jgi:DnaJ-class molecular chaperone